MRSTAATSARFALSLMLVALSSVGCASDEPETNGIAGSGVVAGSAGRPSAAAGATSDGGSSASTPNGGAPSSGAGGVAGTQSGGTSSGGIGGVAGTQSGGASSGGIGGLAGGGSAGQAAQGGSAGVAGAVSPAGAGGTPASAGSAGGPTGGQGGGAAKPEAEIQGAGWPMKCTKPDTGNLCYLLPEGKDTCPQGGYTSLDRTLHFGGTPGVTYQVTIRFQGTHEAGDYRGGTADPPQFLRNATHIDGGLHTWLSMEVSSPAAVYNPNSGGGGGSVQVYDYMATVPIEGGATIRLKAFDSDCLMHRYCQNGQTTNCKGLVVPGISPAEAPIDGSFLQMTVLSVVPE